MDKMASVYLDAEVFTDRMIYLTNNGMQNNKLSSSLSTLVVNLIRIMNLDVEDRMEIIDAPSGKTIVLLFANNTECGQDSVYVTERIFSGDKKVDIIVLPNDQLLNKINNAFVLSSLNNVYAFILETQKASATYISPMEVFKHVYARHYFKLKYYSTCFELDEKTIEALKKDIKDSVSGLFEYDKMMEVVQLELSATDLFIDNDVLSEMESEIYFHIIDELNGAFDEEDEDIEE